MSNIAIEFQNVGKQYHLGTVGTGTLSHDLNRFWQTKVLRHEDPYLKIGETNDRTKKGNSDYVWALRDISFKVEQGEVLGIIGKNGAGKSTLLKLLSNITSPTTGTIKYQGRIASLLEVGTGFHPEMTGRENIYMNGSIMGMTKAEITRKLDEIVDFAGVERYLDTPVKRYSSGMTVRLGFAVAAFLEPEILVVDEVLTVGDAEFQKKAIGKMQDVSCQEGRTVLFVSHNMGSVRALCTKGIILKNGTLAFSGSVEDAIDRYIYNPALLKNSGDITSVKRSSKCSNQLRFESIEYLDNEGNNIVPHCGHPLCIRLRINCTSANVKNCNFSIGIRNMYGSPLVSFPTKLTTDGMELSPGIHYLDCFIEKLPLTGGVYNVGLWADVRGECADFIDNEIQMEVEDDTFFNNKKIIDDHFRGKIVLCNHHWGLTK